MGGSWIILNDSHSLSTTSWRNASKDEKPETRLVGGSWIILNDRYSLAATNWRNAIAKIRKAASKDEKSLRAQLTFHYFPRT